MRTLRAQSEELQMKINVTNDCAYSKIKPAFLPIVDQGIKAYQNAIQNNNIINIRLMGSVPRGDAREIHSDIDFVVICRHKLSLEEDSKIQHYATLLSSKNKQVRKVDLEYETIGEINPAREFVFITDSISLYGDDIYNTKGSYEIEAKQLAENNTPNLDRLLSDYRDGIHRVKTNDEIIQFSRWIGKDILKALRYRLIVEKNIYEKAAIGIHFELCKNYPDDKSTFDNLLDAYMYPTNDVIELNNILNKVEAIKEMYTTRKIA